MSADEEGEIKPEREKTDGGRVLINEVRQEEGAPRAIKRVALVPPAQTIDRNSIMDGIIDTMQHFVKDELGAAYAQFITILDTQPLSMDNKMIINGEGGTIHRAVEISHTDTDVMRMFDAMVDARNHQGGIDILGVPLHFVFPMRATEMAADSRKRRGGCQRRRRRVLAGGAYDGSGSFRLHFFHPPHKLVPCQLCLPIPSTTMPLHRVWLP